MFTGKPYIGELGYAFLFRNYRPGLGKWLTCDPLGYPDGWNNLAYVNNVIVSQIDPFGTKTVSVQGIATKADSEFGGFTFVCRETTGGYTYQVTSSWTQYYDVNWAQGPYFCEMPNCAGHYYTPSEEDNIYKIFAPSVIMSCGTYETQFEGEELYKMMYQWQENLKKKMKEDIDELPQSVPLTKNFSIRCPE